MRRGLILGQCWLRWVMCSLRSRTSLCPRPITVTCQVIPVLVLNQSDWPAQDGSSGLTSLAAIQAALKAGTAVEAPSNFFLFFSSYVNSHDKSHHYHMQ